MDKLSVAKKTLQIWKEKSQIKEKTLSDSILKKFYSLVILTWDLEGRITSF